MWERIPHRDVAQAGGGRGWPSLKARAWWITAIYALFAAAWIYFSDQLLLALLPNPERFVEWSVYKGLVFVVITSFFLLLLLRRAFLTIEVNYTALQAREQLRLTQEAEISRLNRLYAALSQVNQAIVRTPTRAELLPKVCQVLVESGQFRVAWIDWYDPDAGRLIPVAEWGDAVNRLQCLPVAGAESLSGRGPAGLAFRARQAYICNDVFASPLASLWREEAQRLDYRAAASLPIWRQGDVCGLLNVYASELNFFQDKEIALLTEAATSIAFALESFEHAAARHAAQAIAEHEQRFSTTIIDSMPGILYLYTDAGRFLRWNQNFETVSGYSSAEIAQMHPLEFFAAEDQQALSERIAAVFTTGASFIEAPFLAKDGTATPYLFTGRRIAFGDRECLVGMGVDISARIQVEAERRATEARFRTTLDSMLEGCQILDLDWRYQYLNPAAATQNRRPNDELLGRTMLETWPGIEHRPIFAMLKRCMDERIGVHGETEFGFRDGSSGWFDVRCQPVPEGIFVLSIDISERRAAESALLQLNQTLEQKVVERTQELQVALVRAEAADRIKSAFLATMSHELRTPLNSIIGFTGIILQELAGPLTAEQARQLGMVRHSARHLLDLINDVLDLSKIEAGQLEVCIEPLDLPAVITQAIDTIRPQAEAKGLILHVHIAPAVRMISADRRRLSQVLMNLLQNAVKFTDRGSVTLTAQHHSHMVQICVIDTGIGIKPKDLELLFQPFRQIDTGLTRQHEGTGLGLAICRRLVSLMDGTISVTSEWPHGSTFCVTLPLQRSE